MSKTKTERLNELFTEWKRNIEEADRMCRDGIVCEKRYEKTDPQLLFVTKEPNLAVGPGFDFREWWSSEPVQYGFSKRLCEWSYGVQNRFPPLSEFDQDKSNESAAIRSISFMNLKKVGGSGSADPEVIRSYADRDKELLRRQIEIIDPDVIVGGIGRDSRLWSFLFPDIILQDCGFDIEVARVGRVRVIDFYHPSYPIPRAMSYSLLGRVFHSRIFTEL